MSEIYGIILFQWILHSVALLFNCQEPWNILKCTLVTLLFHLFLFALIGRLVRRNIVHKIIIIRC